MDLSGIISQSITARLQEHNNTNNKFVEVIQISFTNTSHIFCFESFFYSRNIPMQPFSEIWRQCIQIFLGVSGAWTLSCKCWRSSHLACDIYTTQFKTVALSFHNLGWRGERERENSSDTHPWALLIFLIPPTERNFVLQEAFPSTDRPCVTSITWIIQIDRDFHLC